MARASSGVSAWARTDVAPQKKTNTVTMVFFIVSLLACRYAPTAILGLSWQLLDAASGMTLELHRGGFSEPSLAARPFDEL
jgi:hypothetical protein